MTELISKQLLTMAIMGACGVCAGIVMEVFDLFLSKFLKDKEAALPITAENNNKPTAKLLKKTAQIIVMILECMVIAYQISEFAFFAQNGKITFTAIGSFFAGLLLWLKYFCGKINFG